MAYSDKVIDHYLHPRNVGSMDKAATDVGTGLVGAPECVSGKTLIATADGSNFKTIEELFIDNKPVLVWSFNLAQRQFQIKRAMVICTGDKEMDKIVFDDGTSLEVTPDHEFLTRPFYRYAANQTITNESIRPFRRCVDKRGYWRIRDSKEEEQYREIYKSLHGLNSLEGFNVHHLDEDKRNDAPSNLKLLSIHEHRKISSRAIRKAYYQNIHRKFSLDATTIRHALETTYDRAEAADALGVYTDELCALMRLFGIRTERKLTKDELREASSLRMKTNNPYNKFTPDQKLAFATHDGNNNGRWLDITEEDMLEVGHEVLEREGKLTASLWRREAEKRGYPQNIHSRFSSWNEFKESVEHYNHKIVDRTSLGKRRSFTLQVEENNNFVVVTKATKNIHSGIVVHNCGDVMKLQIKVNKETGVIEDAKFKTFGCGSAIASSSLATEWVKGKTVDEALAIRNTDIVRELALPPVKIHCSVLAEDAIKAAIADWKKKNL